MQTKWINTVEIKPPPNLPVLGHWLPAHDLPASKDIVQYLPDGRWVYADNPGLGTEAPTCWMLILEPSDEVLRSPVQHLAHPREEFQCLVCTAEYVAYDGYDPRCYRYDGLSVKLCGTCACVWKDRMRIVAEQEQQQARTSRHIPFYDNLIG